MRLVPHFLFVALAVVVLHGGAGAAELSPKETGDAKKLYNTKCAKCHKFYDPAAYTDKEWADWMTKMNRKSKLKPEQAELLARYLETLRPGKTNAVQLRP